jgi:uncharacterized secreted protein with C-terminal beta-propeller domain
MVNNLSEIDRSERDNWMKAYKKKKIFTLGAAVLAVIFLFGAGMFVLGLGRKPHADKPQVGAGAPAAAISGEMKKFGSYEELLAFMEKSDSAAGSAVMYKNMDSGLGLSSTTNSAVPMTSGAAQGLGAAPAPTAVPEAATDNGSASPQEGGTGSDHSSTNVQVAGVDEDDIVKTDGNYIYSLSGKNVLIFKATPASETELLSTITLDYYPSGLYIDGDKLAVFGSNYDIKPLKEYSKLVPGRNSYYADLRIYNVSDRKQPALEKRYDFEGSFQDSRMIGDYVYFVTQTSPVFAYYKTRPVPYMLEDGVVSAPASTPSVYYFDTSYTSKNMTSVNAINLKDTGSEVKTETYVLDGYQNAMYVSTGNLYITFSKYVSQQQLTIAVIRDYMLGKLNTDDQEKVKEIEAVKDYILSADEKSNKIMQIFTDYIYSQDESTQKQLNDELSSQVKAKYKEIMEATQKTNIHKIAIKDGTLTYVGEGSVPGSVINQYAMDESADGFFRIATTVNAGWIQFGGEQLQSYNNLYVLDAEMKRAGAVEDIGVGETIQAVRFMGDRAYVVTFKRTDPLFVIGLTDNRQPKLLGELKVPGYSTYLHPYDNNLLIGLGKNTDDKGVEIEGIKLTLFDASDVSNPKEVNTYILGDYGSSSSAQYDPKAFLFSKEKNLLVIPATVRKATGTDKYDSKVFAAGAAVFGITPAGFEFRAILDHRTEDEKKNAYSGTEAKRSLYIGDYLYTYSDNFLKVSALSDLANLKDIALPKSEEPIAYPLSSGGSSGTAMEKAVATPAAPR